MVCHWVNSIDYKESVIRKILFSQFEARGYPHAWLQSAYDKAKVLNRQQLLHKAHKRPRTYFAVKCVLTFSEQSYQIKEIITIHWNILSTDPSLGDILKNSPLFIYKRSNNIANKLVKSDIYTDKTKTFIKGCFPCRNCAACSSIIKTNQFSDVHSGRTFFIKSLVTCSTSNVIYMLNVHMSMFIC